MFFFCKQCAINKLELELEPYGRDFSKKITNSQLLMDIVNVGWIQENIYKVLRNLTTTTLTYYQFR